jgi:hypothetical protein
MRCECTPNQPHERNDLGRADRCTENHIVVGYNELIPRRVTRVRYLFKEQGVRRPIELSLK